MHPFMFMSKTNIMTINILYLLLIRKPQNESLLLYYGTEAHQDGSKYWIGGFPSVKKSNQWSCITILKLTYSTPCSSRRSTVNFSSVSTFALAGQVFWAKTHTHTKPSSVYILSHSFTLTHQLRRTEHAQSVSTLNPNHRAQIKK